MTDVRALLDDLRRRSDCVIHDPAGAPITAPKHNLPDDLATFYALCGGLAFRTPPPMCLVAPSRFLPINEVVLGEQFPDDASAGWYLLAESDASASAERISIDLRHGYEGWCYESFWDRHGVAGSMSIVSRSFTTFLARLSAEGIFWTAEGFIPLGDAYDA